MRKKIVLISLIATLFLLGILCYKSWVAGFVVTKYLSGRKDGKQGIVRSVIIPWRNHQLHLHHWFISLIGGGICAVKGFYILAPEVFYGFLSAVIFQGIYCYGDWYRIVMRSRRMTPTSRSLLTGVLKVQDYGIEKSVPPIGLRHALTEDGAASLSTETTLTAIASRPGIRVTSYGVKMLECTRYPIREYLQTTAGTGGQKERKGRNYNNSAGRFSRIFIDATIDTKLLGSDANTKNSLTLA